MITNGRRPGCSPIVRSRSLLHVKRSTERLRCFQGGANRDVFRPATASSSRKRSAGLHLEAKNGRKHHSVTLVSCQSHAWLKEEDFLLNKRCCAVPETAECICCGNLELDTTVLPNVLLRLQKVKPSYIHFTG